MSDIDRIRKAREARHAVDEALFSQQNLLRAKESQLVLAKRQGAAGSRQVAILEREIAALMQAIERQRSALRDVTKELSGLVGEFVLPQSPQQLASTLDDGLPCVLLPVRMETRFMGEPGSRELWVRVYPDDIAVHTHEKTLTRDEALTGIEYWTTLASAASISDRTEKERVKQGAWRALANGAGGTRASWIISEIERRALEKPENSDLSFLLIRRRIAEILGDPRLTPATKRTAIIAVLQAAHPLNAVIRASVENLLNGDPTVSTETRKAILQTTDEGALNYLGFDPAQLMPESWSRAPRTEVLPDRFVLVGITDSERQEWPFPNAVPSPLILGPNPQALESELAQRNGDLVVGEEFAWIWDFEAATKKGMAMRLPLTEPFASRGFDRLMVLGLRVSDEPADHKRLLEVLIDNHHYSPDGMAFLPQGTPTNHTSDVRSGFSTEDAEGDASFSVQTQAPIEPVNGDRNKSDAQRLAEAWDVSLEILGGLANAARQDVSRAKIMNSAMWPATLGFFLEELLETDAALNDRIRRFFTADVLARSSLPAIRVGKQPYGILVTSAFAKWQVDDRVDGPDAAFLRQVHDVLIKVQDQWQQLVSQVAHVDAPGDSFAQLLNILGLHPTSVDYQRRIATFKAVLWNLAHLMIGGNLTSSDPIVQYFQNVSARGLAVVNALGFEFQKLPRLFGLLFSESTSHLNGPFVDDVEKAEDEKLSETDALPAKYAVATDTPDEVEARNYIGWLVSTTLDELKQQKLVGENGAVVPIPAPLLYRMLHRALLLAFHDATMKLYAEANLVSAAVRREQDFTNVEAGRTVTRWEFMQARIGAVMPQITTSGLAVADFLATPNGLARPAADLLREVKESIAELEQVPTAELERLTAEHLDLCSYRLDAWQGALFSRRLASLNQLREPPTGAEPKRGVHLGAYGWLESVRPAPPAPVVPPEQIPEALREQGVSVIEQPGNGGYIHGPSINHAVTAAVLRNAYLTHANQQNAAHFSIELTSERVRTALSFLEGIRNGQELGALLGYQFERALHDRYVIDGKALAQFILAFRKQYPLVADKVTPSPDTASIDVKEVYQVVDGYALVEAAFLAEPPVAYPYGVGGLPADPTDLARQAIVAEVERLRDTLDAISDLSLAEGVFQATQGNYDRAGAMLKSITEGYAPPEPEISRTPRGGAVVNHKVAIHFPIGPVDSAWNVSATPRSIAAPGLNRWLGDRIGPLDSLQFSVRYDLDNSVRAVPLASLALQPIDLVYLVGDEVGALEGTRQVNDLTELEVRIDHAYRVARAAADPAFDASGKTTIQFMSREALPATVTRTFFDVLPLFRTLRNLVTTSRPLAASDYLLASEQNTDPTPGGNVKRWNLAVFEQMLIEAMLSLDQDLTSLDSLLAAVPNGALNADPAIVPDLSAIDYNGIRSALIRLALYGLASAFPKRALLPKLSATPTPVEVLALLRARQSLIQQAFATRDQGTTRHADAESLRKFAGLNTEERNRLTVEEIAERFQRAAGLVLGDAFRILPTFTFANQAELESAREFAVGPPASASLMRFSNERLAAAATGSAIDDWRDLAVDEWLQGAAAVRRNVRFIDELHTYEESFDAEPVPLEPLQLPFDRRAHWIAMEFPEVAPEQLDDPTVFVPRGDFLSIVRHLPEGHDVADVQTGLLVDEWSEVIPNRIETTGIAVHYNQPNTEPPQCILVAVSPKITGRWAWEDLVDTLIDTFDRAKRRGVEPDFLRTTPYAQLLPAVVSSFASFPFATLSTNLAVQPASMVVGNE